MEKLSGILVTDRTQADVNARNEKGTYNDVDLNRVLRACTWLAGRLERYGYAVPGEYFPAVLISVSADPPGGGSVKGAVCYEGETAVVTAVSGDGYTFRRWEERGKVVSTARTYSFTAEADRELTAVFGVIAEEESSVVGLGVVGTAILGKDRV